MDYVNIVNRTNATAECSKFKTYGLLINTFIYSLLFEYVCNGKKKESFHCYFFEKMSII